MEDRPHSWIRRLYGLYERSRILSGRTDDTEFLPAALEVVRTPPNPAAHLIARFIMAFVLVALLWSVCGRVDIIATASGKIVPTGRTKIVQPMEQGVVRAIHVQDGQRVKAGDVLIEIDTTVSASERDRLTNDHMQAMLDVVRLKAALSPEGNPAEHFTAPEGASPKQIELQKNILTNQAEGIRAKLSTIDHQIAQNTGNRDAVVSTAAKLTESIPYLRKRAEARKSLLGQGYGSKLDYLTIEQDLVEHEQELSVQKGRLKEAEAAIEAHKEERKQAEDEYRHGVLKDLAEAEQKAASLQEQLAQAVQKYRLQTLTAPVDGTVQQLAVHTEGGVVTPAEALLSIVPADSRLEIEAMVSNKDIGFVHADEEAEIKIDTFNFTRYGLIRGKVQSVSQDAIGRQKPQGRQPRSEEPDSSEPAGEELVYSARVALDKTQMDIDGTMVGLAPGMAVTVEIKTGSRRIIEYLLSPLARHAQQAFREQ